MRRFLTLFAVGIMLFTLSYQAGAQVKEKGFFLRGGVGYAWGNFDEDELEVILRMSV